MPIMDIAAWAEDVELVVLPGIQTDMAILRQTVTETNNSLYAWINAYSSSLADVQSRADDAVTSAGQAGSSAQAYTDVRVQEILDSIPTIFEGWADGFRNEITNTVLASVIGDVTTAVSDVTAAASAAQQAAADLGLNLDDVQSLASQILDTELPAQQATIDNLALEAASANSSLSQLLTGMETASLMEALDLTESRVVEAIRPLRQTLFRLPATNWTMEPDGTTFAAKLPPPVEWFLSTDPVFGDALDLDGTTAAAVGPAYPAAFDPAALYKISARFRVLALDGSGKAQLRAGATTWTSTVDRVAPPADLVVAEGVSVGQVVTAVWYVTADTTLANGLTNVLVLAGSQAAPYVFHHVRHLADGSHIRLNWLEVEDITLSQRAVNLANSIGGEALENAQSAIDAINAALEASTGLLAGNGNWRFDAGWTNWATSANLAADPKDVSTVEVGTLLSEEDPNFPGAAQLTAPALLVAPTPIPVLPDTAIALRLHAVSSIPCAVDLVLTSYNLVGSKVSEFVVATDTLNQTTTLQAVTGTKSGSWGAGAVRVRMSLKLKTAGAVVTVREFGYDDTTAQEQRALAVVARNEAASYSEDASGSAAEAAASETVAVAARNEAGDYATSAATSASSAVSSANDAEVAASAAEVSKVSAQTAQGLAEAARTAATESSVAAGQARDAALLSQTAAATSANAAGLSADAASSFSQAAETKADEASQSAVAAESHKTAAETAKSAAQVSQTNAATSASNAATSASTASQQQSLTATALNSVRKALNSVRPMLPSIPDPALLNFSKHTTLNTPADAANYASDANGPYVFAHALNLDTTLGLIGAVPLDATGRVYRLRVRFMHFASAATVMRMKMMFHDAAGVYFSTQVFTLGKSGASFTPGVLHEITMTMGSAIGGLVDRYIGQSQWLSGRSVRFHFETNAASTAPLRIYECLIEDLTEADRAARQTGLAAGHAQAAYDHSVAANASATTAGEEADAALVAKLAAETARGLAETARSESVTARDTAEGHAASASTSASTAAAARDAASGYEVSAQTARDQASSYAIAADEAKGAAEDALELAVQARNAAGGFADAAAGHVTTAAGHVTAAGQFAEAADQFRLAAQTANTQAGLARDAAVSAQESAEGSAGLAYDNYALAVQAASDASGHADTASNHRAAAALSETNALSAQQDAEGASAAAISARDLAVRISSQGNGCLADQFCPDAAWPTWTTAPIRQANSIYPLGKELRFDLMASNAQAGVVTSTTRADWKGQKLSKAFRVEVEFTLHAGSLEGAGVLVDFNISPSDNRAQKKLAQMLPQPVILGKMMLASVEFRMPTTIELTNVTSVEVFLMANYSGLGVVTPKDITFHRIQIYPITYVEAAVSEQQTAIADLQGNASAGYLIKAQAGNTVSLLELVAADGSTGSVSVAKISADNILLDGTVSTSKLIVSDFSGNLIPNGSFQYGDLRGWSGVPTTFTILAHGGDGTIASMACPSQYCLRIVTDATGDREAMVLDKFQVQVAQERISLSFALATSGGTRNATLRMRVVWYSAAGVEIYAPTVLDELNYVGTDWKTVRGVVEAPAGAVYGRIYLRRVAGGAGTAYVTLLEAIRQRNGATLITPSGITSNLVAAGAITAEHVATSSITAKQMVIADWANPLVGSEIEETSGWLAEATGSWSAAQTYDGKAQALCISANPVSATAFTFSNPLPVEQGDRYYISFWMYRTSDWNGVATNSRLRFADEAGAHLAALSFASADAGPNVWVKRSRELVIPAGVSALNLTLVGGATAGQCYLSDLVIRRKSGGELLVDGSIGANHVTAGELVTGSAQIRNAIINDAHISNLSAAKLVAGSALAGSITVNGTALDTVRGNAATGAQDPATRINAGVTKIDPGKIVISGSATLADWRGGTDTTKIKGGAIEANSISANVLKIGLRGVTLTTTRFEHNSPNVNDVSWTAGTIRYTDDTGNTASVSIAAGQATWTSGVRYIYWSKGATTLSSTTSLATADSGDNVVIATYTGGKKLDVNFGRTVIDGSDIKTGTVTADQVTTGELITKEAQIKNAIIQGAHIKNLSVDTLKIADEAVTKFDYAYSSAVETISGSNQNNPLETLVINRSRNQPVIIHASVTVDWPAALNSDPGIAYAQIYDVTNDRVITSYSLQVNTAAYWFDLGYSKHDFFGIDTATVSGNITYRLRIVTNDMDGSTMSVKKCFIGALNTFK